MSRKNASWTTHKIARLRECYPTMTRAELAKEFAPHPIGSIIYMAWRLKISKINRWQLIAQQHVPVIVGVKKAGEVVG